MVYRAYEASKQFKFGNPVAWRVRCLLALLLLPLATAPAAAESVCAAEVCVEEGSVGEDCDQPGASAYHYDRVAYYSHSLWVVVEGKESCNRDESGNINARHGIVLVIGVYVPGRGVHGVDAGWVEQESVWQGESSGSCSVAVTPIAAPRPPDIREPCPTGPPPQPGWGTLLD
jgi:hypothetical protein